MFHRGTFEGSRIWMPPANQQADERREIHENIPVEIAAMHEPTLAAQLQREAAYYMILYAFY